MTLFENIYNLIISNNIQLALTELNNNKENLSENDYFYLLVIILLKSSNIQQAVDIIEKIKNFTNDQRIINLSKFLQLNSSNSNNLKMLNLGCGQRYHKDWINIDFTSSSPYVIAHNLIHGIPFADNYFDVVYHSHVLEHFPKSFSQNFINECYRVLKPNGIIRVVVPDLEQIIKEYLKNLEMAIKGDKIAEEKYNWIMLEMYDQTVRNQSGGEMIKYLIRDDLIIKDYILQRVGDEALNIINNKENLQIMIKNQKNEIDLTEFEIGNFRKSGEIHQWMYDRYSLGKLLNNAGFKNIQIMKFNESAIPNFNDYKLDFNDLGQIRKPDSLYMEAIK